MRNAIVVDLDGTLFKTNTFKHFIVFVVKKALKKFDLFTALILLSLVALRKIRLISTHEKMKYKVLKRSSKYVDKQLMDEFVEVLFPYVNRKVLDVLDNYKNTGYRSILSTAAPCCYADLIGQKYLFDATCSSEMPANANWTENVRETKKANTLALLQRCNMTMQVLVTDHYDDIPLLLEPKERNIVVYPSPKTIVLLNKNGIKYDIM